MTRADSIYKIISLHRNRLRTALKVQDAKKVVKNSVELFGFTLTKQKNTTF